MILNQGHQEDYFVDLKDGFERGDLSSGDCCKGNEGLK